MSPLYIIASHVTVFRFSVHVVTASLLLLPMVEGGDVERYELLVLFVFHYSGCLVTVLSSRGVSHCHLFPVGFTVGCL